MAIVKRLVKGSALTYAELDGNFDHLTAADAAHIDDTSGAHASSAISYTRNGTGATASTVYAKLNQSISPLDFGAVGDGSTDDTTAIQAAIDYAETIGGTINGLNLEYAVSSQITIGGGLSITLKDITLKAIAGTWPTGADGAMLKISQSTNYRDRNHSFININCNCGHIAKTGFYVYAVQARTIFFDCHAYSFDEYGWWIATASGDGNNDIGFVSCSAAEWLYAASGTGYNDYSLRAAYAWYVVDSADCQFIDCKGSSALRSLYVSSHYNTKFIGCTFWNGEARTETDSVTVEIDADANAIQFIGCRFDDGAVKLYNFNTQFNGCYFIQYDANYQLDLQVTTATNALAGLVVQGCRFTKASPVTVTLSGSGSLATNLLVAWMGNITTAGAVVTLEGLMHKAGPFKFADGQATFGDGANLELLALDGAAGTNRMFQAKTAGETRWQWGATSTAESGSDTGSNWGLYAYDDDGVYKNAAITVNRATYKADFYGPIAFTPGSSAAAMTVNGQVTFELTNNTTLTLKARGSDGTTRSVALTLA